MAISFGLFTVFVFFLIFYLRPVRNQSIGDVLVDAIEAGIKQETSIELIELTLITNNVTSPCFKILSPFITFNSDNIVIKNSSYRSLKFDLQDDNLITENSGIFYALFYSNVTFFHNPLNLNCPLLNLSQYKYGAPRTYQMYYYPYFERLKEEYDNSYDKLKQNLSFPALADFSINVTDRLGKDGIFSMTRKKPLRIEVNAKDLPIEIINPDGTTQRAVLNIQVW